MILCLVRNWHGNVVCVVRWDNLAVGSMVLDVMNIRPLKWWFCYMGVLVSISIRWNRLCIFVVNCCV